VSRVPVARQEIAFMKLRDFFSTDGL
jgi:hypothetical protein